MRIVIDLQGAQSSGSRNRGIGRYTTSFVQEFIKQKNADDEIIVVLNGLLTETIKPIIAEFHEIIPESDFRIWGSIPGVNHVDPNCRSNRKIAESIRERFIASLNPDLILVTSLFEGGDDSVVTVKDYCQGTPTAVILYDLIPYLYQDIYLSNENAKNWYLDKINQLRRCDFLLSISESSGKEAIDYLGFSPDDVINISTACHEHFTPREQGQSEDLSVLNKFGLDTSYIMYTGGIDHRKNIEGLIEAYSLLPRNIRQLYKLAIVCKINEQVKLKLYKLATDLGIDKNSLVLTDFVTEYELVELYRSCSLFVFPSWHEGFGLPALEAMACGKAVVGSQTSSVPEVLGREDILFDPYDVQDISRKILNVLSDGNIRKELESYSLDRAKLFSWDSSAKTAWIAIRERFGRSLDLFIHSPRKKLAMISPLPPAKSGVSEYTFTLLNDLAAYYDIELIIADSVSKPVSGFECRDLSYFREFYSKYDRVVYHVGNSTFHSEIFELIKYFPGIIVLHDFFLSSVLHLLEESYSKNGIWSNEILEGHGYGALKTRSDVETWLNALIEYPSNFSFLQHSLGVIVHSMFSFELARKFYPTEIVSKLRISPMVRKLKNNVLSKKSAKEKLGYKSDDFLICSFGIVDQSKCNRHIIDSLALTKISAMSSVKMVMVGEGSNEVYRNELMSQIRSFNGNAKIEITGWVSDDVYEQFLIASDLAIQLRVNSRGETSAAVHDVLIYGIPLIVNDYASFSYYSESEVVKIPADFSKYDLAAEIDRVYQDSELCHKLSQNLLANYPRTLSPRASAKTFQHNIEDCYRVYNEGLGGLVSDLSRLTVPCDIDTKQKIVRHVESIFYRKSMPKDFWLISENAESDKGKKIADYYDSEDKLNCLEFAFAGNRFLYADEFFHRILNIPKLVRERGDISFSERDRIVINTSYVSPSELVRSLDSLDFALIYNCKIYLIVDDEKFLESIFDIVVNDYNHFKMITKLFSLLEKIVFCSSDALNAFYAVNECFGLRKGSLPRAAKISSPDTEDIASLISCINSQDADFELNNPRSLMFFSGSDTRFSSQVGERLGRAIATNGQQGFLLFGPYASLAAGSYEIIINLEIENVTPVDFIDVACDRGELQLGHLSIIDMSFDRSTSFTLSIDLDHVISDLEIRVFCGAESIIRINEILIQKAINGDAFVGENCSAAQEHVTNEVVAESNGAAVMSKSIPVKKPIQNRNAKSNKRRKR